MMNELIHDRVMSVTRSAPWANSINVLLRNKPDDWLDRIYSDSLYYINVPKGIKENIRYRKRLIEAAKGDKEAQRELWIICSRDPLFFINALIFTYDPRKKSCPVVPFITYPFQDYAILKLVEAVGSHDTLIEKSRDMGASWISLFVMTWYFLFRDMQTFLCVSRKEDIVDKTEDPDSLFWKIDFMIDHLPGWMRPPVQRAKLHFYNESNGSTIDGSSTTGDLSRGGRRTALFLDEFASVEDGHAVLKATRDATDSRIFNSTPKGTGNAFYDMTLTDIEKLRFHWTEHPTKSAGLYESIDGKVVVLDTAYRFPVDYPFLTDGKVRSPWYDLQCRRAAHPMEIAQELDIDYLGSSFQFFDAGVIERCKLRDSRKAFHAGELRFDADTLRPVEFATAE